MIRLYHGSNVDIEQIDLSRSKRGKDFGQGFYLNANSDQAMEMAVRTTLFLNHLHEAQRSRMRLILSRGGLYLPIPQIGNRNR